MILPRIDPWSAFNDRRFLASWRRPIMPELDGPGRVTVHAASEGLRQRLLSEYNRIAHETVGVLKGDYGVGGAGTMLFDRDGACLAVNVPSDAYVFDEANSRSLRENRSELYRDWESVRLVENATIVSNIYHNNYYHFTFELIQKFRLLRDYDVQTVVCPGEALSAPFKRDLLVRAMGNRVLLPSQHSVRVRDPVLVETGQTPEGLFWLRGLYPLSAAPSGRKVYVRRGAAQARRGNNVAESAQFRSLLDRYDFSVVDFGSGEVPIEEQIRMLDGASVILSVHGAGLTNLTYVQAPVRVIEVSGPAVLSSAYMRISSVLGFDHHAVISSDLDEAGDIVVDCGLIEDLLA